MAKWKKITPYGDYRDPLQNHKFGILIKDKNGEIISAKNRHTVLVNQSRWYYGKHVGSKKLKNLLSFVNKSNNIRSMIKIINAKSRAINEALDKQKEEKEQITDAEIVS